ncbi:MULTISPECIES: hypothetical protein [Brevibacillus]|jgi:CBS-domain-containing membrane protein|uniref:Uncharacterized protein n=1 Tax=Brevibacillus borstelensis AK1 TaxID=1300222 RepID=M8DA92_9BACL|nr:hypothetical protein [Brevibacillus borstelensis]EMT53179.1 hypothetical protein I532_10387 [Brevibacillus borstelensis AK1]MBE5397604.1 hypothetical protein [Brevibacillus borstelensis]MCC0563602.1 hypothetical protein [Brevibacillus borstelensis]MCM3469245.1 hypothetical protein [Brevibacillus borstelensis]MCM3558808.1 hypothetical protein [Brevibacillus borstelensis]
MRKSLTTGCAIALLIVLAGLLKNDYQWIMTWTFYSAAILFTLGALVSFSSLQSTAEPPAYFQQPQQEHKDNKSRIRWTSFFFLAALPNLFVYGAFYFFST